MSTNRFFLATRGLALTLLGAGALAVADAGCGVSVTSLCQQICDCTGCNATQRQACEAGFNDSQKLAGDKSCSSTYDAYEGCVASHVQCIGNMVDLTACATESGALAACTGTVTMVTGPSQVSCDVVSGTTHVCDVYANLSSTLVTSLNSACTSEKGTIGTACPTAGALGACKVTSAGITTSQTFYADGSLTASIAASACAMANGTWTPN